MNLPISRETYTDENLSPEQGRGLTYDLLTLISESQEKIIERLDKLPCDQLPNVIERLDRLEKRKGSAATVVELMFNNTKATIVFVIAMGLALGIAFGTVALTDINILQLIK